LAIDESEINESPDRTPNVSKVYLSRPKLAEFYSNHKTVGTTDYLISEHNELSAIHSNVIKYSHRKPKYLYN